MEEIAEAMRSVLEGEVVVSNQAIVETQKIIEDKYSLKEWNRQVLRWYFEK